MDFLVLVLLIVFNGVLSLSEMAIVSARKPRLKAMAERGSVGAKTALRLLDDPSKLLSTAQVGITTVSVLSGAYGATSLMDEVQPLVTALLPGPAEAYAPAITFGLLIVMVTFLSLMFGELIPKRIALAAPEMLAASISPIMVLIETAASPLIWLLRTLTEGFVHLLRLDKTRQDVTEEELQSLIDEGAEAGVLEEGEREMIESVMRLSDRSVKAIMTPRTEMVWLDPEQPQQEILTEIMESKHSRFPVGERDADHIVGFVQAKELLAHMARTGQIDLVAVMHPPQFVPETMPVLNLLESMRGNPVRMVMVADEYGAVLGLVTALDLLEAIAGDAALSEDEAIAQPVERADGSWLIDGMMPIDEFQEDLDVRGLDDEEGYSTVAGYVMHLLRAVPKEGDRVEHWPLTFEVIDMDGRRIDKLIVRRMPELEDDTG